MKKLNIPFDATLMSGRDEVTDLFGLVIESRGGTKNSKNHRNPEYSDLLGYVLMKIETAGIFPIEFYLSSKKGKYTPLERRLDIQGESSFDLTGMDIFKFKTRLQDEIRKFGQKSETKAGNRTRRLLVYAPGQYQTLHNQFLSKNNSPDDIPEKEIEYVYSVIKKRLRDTKFRKNLLTAYDGRCAVSGTNVSVVLEAAHIMPYATTPSNKITDGILLRADLHTLYDAGLLKISKDYKVLVDNSLKHSEYWQFNQKTIFLPHLESDWPNFNE